MLQNDVTRTALGITLSTLTSACTLTHGEPSPPGGRPAASSAIGEQPSVEASCGSRTTAEPVVLRTAEDLGIPRPGMEIDPERTAIDGSAERLPRPRRRDLGRRRLERDQERYRGAHRPLFAVAQERSVPVFLSPHYDDPHDHHWYFEGSLEHLMHDVQMFARPDQLSSEGFEGSGADWLEQYEPYIAGDIVVVCSPHEVYGPETNDLILQLRKRGIDKIVLAGMSANLCTESHMRELIEQGFEVTVVSDATAGAITPAGNAWEIALANYRSIASAVVTTEAAVAGLEKAYPR